MKLYRVDTPQPCDIEECPNINAVLIVRTDEDTNHAVCPTHVLSMSMMNSENAEFFAQVPLPGKVAYPEGMKQGRYIQDTNPDLPDQLQASHARHCAIECGFIHKPEQEQYIQGYLAGYAKRDQAS